MKKSGLLTIVFFCMFALLSIESCRTDLYDKEQYEKFIKYMSPVDSVDQRHEWKLTGSYSYYVTADAGENIRKVLLLDANPLSNHTVNVLNQASITDGASMWISAIVPLAQTKLYAALVSEDGQYYVTSFNSSQTNINFSYTSPKTPSLLTLQPQTFTYIYEKDIPLVDDYDYNDIVLRMSITKDEDTPKQAIVNVTLVAVGCTTQVAAYLRLLDCTYDDVNDVKTADGKTFNDNLPAASKSLVNNWDLFIKGRNNQAVICLFADAHWAMDDNQNLSENGGTFTRKYYNTDPDGDYEHYDTKAYRKQSYIITFKDEKKAREFTLDDLDPFIVTIYNGGRYETHLDNLKFAQVLYPYPLEQDIKDLPWALEIPSESFQHPKEGIQIGFRERTESGAVSMYGAYSTIGHSFGEWVENCESFLDWYNYPEKELVWGF